MPLRVGDPIDEYDIIRETRQNILLCLILVNNHKILLKPMSQCDNRQNIIMKKQIILIGTITMLGLGAFLASCSSTEPSCNCTINGNMSASIVLSSYEATDCADLQVKMMESDEIREVSCQ